MISICILLIILIAGVDLAGKWYVESYLKKGETISRDKDKVVIRKVHNKGMMLNWMDKRPELVKVLSFIATIVVLIYHMFLFRKPGFAKEKVGTALIAGGAISNTFDRIRRGYVVDYIGFNCKWKKASKVTYNLGDFAIFAGAALVLIENIFKNN